MKKSIYGTSIVEVIIVIMIVVIGIIGSYNIYINSIKLSDTTEYRLTAISIAREGIEAVNNIRDTNWKYAGATEYCWFTFNDDKKCLKGGVSEAPNAYFTQPGSYIIKRDSLDDKWQLEKIPSPSVNYKDYTTQFEVKKDDDKLFVQGDPTAPEVYKSITPNFTREIKVSYDASHTSFNSNISSDIPPQKVTVTSIVKWKDSAKEIHTISIPVILTNWTNNDK